MGVGTKPLRRLPWIRGLVALALVAAPVMLSEGAAHAQTAVLGLTKSVSLPNPHEVGPVTPFTYFLSYSCSSLVVDCANATIDDVIPPELSRLASDIKLSGNFITASYDATTGTAHFVLANPVSAGTTAQVAISAQFPAGTPVGTVATNQGTMSASNAAPVTSNQVIVTAKAASQWTVTKNVVPAGAPPQVDTPYTYKVGITLAAGGTQNLNGVVFTDTLPAGAQFVSATGGGTFANGVVTWPPHDMVPNPNADVTFSEQVTVIFPAANFPVGTKILNLVVANGTPAGEPTQELGRAERPGVIGGAGNVTAGSKKDTLPELGPGQSDTYTITAENPNATPLAGFHVTETLPPQLEMVQPGPNLSGTGPPPVSITATPGGNVPINGGGPWTATAPATAGSLLFDFGTAPPNFSTTILVKAGIPASGIDRNGQPITAGSSIQNCIDIAATGTSVNRHQCTDQTIVPVSVEFSKVLSSAPVTVPGQTVSWEIGAGVPATSAGDLTNPKITDCLPPGLDLLDPVNPNNPLNFTSSGFPVAPTLARAAGACGTNQVLLTWTWPAAPSAFVLTKGTSGTIKLNTLVAPDAPPASLHNITDLTSDSLPVALERTADVAVTSETLLRGTKFVKGDRDAAFIPGPGVGNTTRGGTAQYQATIRNVSDVSVTNVIVVDTLPIPGDIGLKDPAPRESGWEPFFAGQFTANPPAATVQYSTSHNPCRADLSVNPPGCEAPNWGPLPADLSSVGAIRVDFGSLVLNPNDAITFSWSMNTPADAPLNSIAWNSFGYVATRTDNGSLLESAEPQKVGLQVIGPGPPPPCPDCQPIPPTGSDAGVMAIVAVVLFTGGLTLLAVSRRASARAAAG
jgi:uncharacterized repeat protein (TIGR01451 family)